MFKLILRLFAPHITVDSCATQRPSQRNTRGVTADVACLQLPMNTWRADSGAVIGRYGR